MILRVMNPFSLLSPSERRALLSGGAVLFVAALVRVGWEARPDPLLFPSDIEAYATLVPETEAAVAAEQRRRIPLEPGEQIDPNVAPAEELARLPGVGPALAARMIAEREANGPFVELDDLRRVQGIGEATLQRLAPWIATDPGVLAHARSLGLGRSAGGGSAFLRVHPGRASVAELVQLPGIGPAIAARIIAHRAEVGGFYTPEDLLAVSGIGPVLLERIRPHLVFSP